MHFIKYTIRSIVWEASYCSVTWSLGNWVTGLLGHLVTLSLGHLVTRSFCFNNATCNATLGQVCFTDKYATA